MGKGAMGKGLIETIHLPKSWKIVSIKEIAGIIVPTRDKPKRFCGDIPWITLPDIKDFFITDAIHQLSHTAAAAVGNRLMPSETVLSICAGSLGKVCLTTREVYANQQFYGLVSNRDLVEPIYLALSLGNLSESFYLGLAGVSTIGFFSKILIQTLAYIVCRKQKKAITCSMQYSKTLLCSVVSFEFTQLCMYNIPFHAIVNH